LLLCSVRVWMTTLEQTDRISLLVRRQTIVTSLSARPRDWNATYRPHPRCGPDDLSIAFEISSILRKRDAQTYRPLPASSARMDHCFRWAPRLGVRPPPRSRATSRPFRSRQCTTEHLSSWPDWTGSPRLCG